MSDDHDHDHEDDHDHDHDHHHHHVALANAGLRRRIDLRSFDEVVTEVKRLQATGYEKAGQWNLAQACRHVAGAMHAQIDGIATRVSLPERLIARFFIKDAIFRSRRLRAGVAAPVEIDAPADGDQAQALTDLQAAITRLLAHDGTSHPHPYFGKLSNEQWRDFHLIHASHHLGFLAPRG